MSPSTKVPAQMEGHVNIFRVNPVALEMGSCSQCRWRKVRCDRHRDNNSGCGCCERLGLKCSFLQPHRDYGEEPIVRPGRLRGPRACVACRDKKIRCSGTLPECIGCQRKGLACSYPKPKRSIRRQGQSQDLTSRDQSHGGNQVNGEGQNHSEGRQGTIPPFSQQSPNLTAGTPIAGNTPSNHDTESIPSPSVGAAEPRSELIDAFFDLVYPLPSYAFLHPQSTKKRCRENPMYRVLASSICAVALLHMRKDLPAAANWIRAAEQSIWLHLECPTIPRLQSLLLIIQYYMETQKFQRAFMLTATAARFAVAMRLNYERPDLDEIAREIRRRIIWSLKIIERYFCLGLAEFEVVPLEAIYIKYPCPDESFGAPLGSGEDGAYSRYIRLETVRRDIMKLIRGITPLEQPLPSLMELMRHHENILIDIGSYMPGGTQLSLDMLEQMIHNVWLPRHILSRIAWHHAYTDLYRILLPGYPEAAPAIVLDAVDPAALESAEKQCLNHATAIIRILVILNQESSKRHILEFDTAICAYHATRILLFISRFGKCHDRPTPEFAASRADLCLTALKRFFHASPLAKPIIDELQYSIGVFAQQQLEKGFSMARLTRLDAEERNDTPSGKGTDGTKAPTPKLAIHSLLRRSEFPDGEEDKTPSDNETEAEQALSQPTPTVSLPEDALSVSQANSAEPSGVNDSVLIGASDLESPPIDMGTDWAAITGLSTSSGVENMGIDYSMFSWFGKQDWDWLSDEFSQRMHASGDAGREPTK